VNPNPIAEIEPETYFFNARELARLEVYRAAVVAGFYSDDVASTYEESLPT
jgi:hypothetical protein